MHTMTRRGALTGLAGIGAAFALSACGDDEKPGGENLDPVKVGYIADFTGAGLMAIAQDKDLWTKHGLDVDLKVFTNGPIQITAFGAGDLDFGYVGPGSLWLPASGQARVVAINSLGFADRVIAQPGITSIAALKGKKVAIPEGTSGDMIVRLALKQAGMTLDDIEKVAMDSSTVVTAFGSQSVDAAGIWYPLVGTIKKKVPDLVELAENEDFYPELSFPAAYVARNEVVTGKPELTKKMIGLLKEANDIRASDVDACVELTAKFIKAPVDQLRSEAENARFLPAAELAAKSKDGTVNGWLDGINDLYQELGKVENPAAASTYYDAASYAAG